MTKTTGAWWLKPGEPPGFQGIPQFIQCTGSGATVEWGQLESWIEGENSDGQKLTLDPDFQRGHVWTLDQQVAYVEFCLRGGESGRTLYFNHPAYTQRPSPGCDLDPHEMLCVDGLQRMTAARGFLADKVPAFGYLASEWQGRLRILQCRFDVRVNHLQTRAEVLQWYLQLNGGGTVHSQEELDRVRGLLAALAPTAPGKG